MSIESVRRAIEAISDDLEDALNDAWQQGFNEGRAVTQEDDYEQGYGEGYEAALAYVRQRYSDLQIIDPAFEERFESLVGPSPASLAAKAVRAAGVRTELHIVKESTA